MNAGFPRLTLIGIILFTACVRPATEAGPCEPQADAIYGQVQTLELGFRSLEPDRRQVILTEARMITGDLNIVDAELLVRYRVQDLEAFTDNVVDPEGCPDGRTLRDASRAAVSQVIGQRSLSNLISEGRVPAEEDTRLLIQQTLNNYHAGIEVLAVVFQNIYPPEEVADVYLDVRQAREAHEETIGPAQAEYMERLASAQAQGSQMIESAEVSEAARVEQAEEQAKSFVATLQAYDREKDQTQQKLQLSLLEGILPGVTVFIAPPDPATSNFQPEGKHIPYRVVESTGQKLMLGLLPGLLNQGTEDHDLRLLYLNRPGASIQSLGSQLLVIDIYVRFRIIQPEAYTKVLENQATANSRVDAIVMAEIRSEAAQRTQGELIGGRVQTEKTNGTLTTLPLLTAGGMPVREAIVRRVRDRAQQRVTENGFGIELVDVRLTRVRFPPSTEASILERMRAEQQAIARSLRAKGATDALNIEARADRAVGRLLAEAETTVEQLRTEGRVAALEILLATVAREPNVSHYLGGLEAYRATKAKTGD